MSAAPNLPHAPYPGLRSFTEQESRLFCGRGLERLRLLRQLESAHFLAVLGSSGSGKSSLVLSGLLPDIRAGRLAGLRGAEMGYAIFRPGRNPFANLAGALFGTWLRKDLPDPFFIEECLRRSHLELARLIRNASAGRSRCLFIVIDQFEEIFRFANLLPQDQDAKVEAAPRDFLCMAGDLNEAQAFITLLLTTARECAGHVRVVTTMRSDFFKHCEVFEGLPEEIAAHQFVTPRMGREQMEDAVELPLSFYNCAIDEALVNDILNDVPGEFDQLPVLQHALARLWQEAGAREGGQPQKLTRADYQRVGRLAGAMNGHAEELMRMVPDPVQVGLFFRCLGDFDPTSGQLIRRPRRLSQIMTETGMDEAAVWRIARAFAEAEASFLQCTPALPAGNALLSGERVIVDLTHECLLRKWAAYREWMGWERRDGDTLCQVTDLMREFGWDGRQTAKGEHLSQGQLHRLTEARLTERTPTWAARYQADVTQVNAFLRAERQYANKRRNVKAAWMWAGVVLVVGGIVLFSWLYNARMRAEAKAAKGAAERSNAMYETERKLLEARKEMERAQAEAADLRAAQETFFRQLSQTQAEAQNQVVGKVGELEAKVGDLSVLVDGLRRLPGKKPPEFDQRLKALGFAPERDPASGPLKLDAPPLKLDDFKRINSIALLRSKDAETFDMLFGGVALHRLSLRIKDGALSPPGEVRPNPTELGSWGEGVGVITVSRLHDSPDWLLVTNGGPSIGLWYPGRQEVQVFKQPGIGVARARLLEGRVIVFGTTKGEVGLLDPRQHSSPAGTRFPSWHSKTINDIVTDQSGAWLLSSGDDNMAVLWHRGEGLSLEPRARVVCGAPVRSASFSPDGGWALLPSGERNTRLYFLRKERDGFGQRRYLLELPHDEPVVAGCFSPDGRWIATATTSGAIRVWEAVPIPVAGETPQPIGAFTNGARVSALVWSPDSSMLAAGDRNGNTIVWRLKFDGIVAGEPRVLPKTNGIVDALAWSMKGELLGVGDSKGAVQVHMAARFQSGEVLREQPPKEDFRQETAAFILRECEGGTRKFLRSMENQERVLPRWLEILLDEGMDDKAERVALRHILAKTSVARTWAGDVDQKGAIPELEAFLCHLVWTYGSPAASGILQEVAGVRADGIAGGQTTAKLIEQYRKDPDQLMRQLQDAAGRRAESRMDRPDRLNQKAREFARTLK